MDADDLPEYLSSLSRATALTELDLSGIGLDTGPEPFKLPPNIVKVNLAGARALRRPANCPEMPSGGVVGDYDFPCAHGASIDHCGQHCL